MPPCIQPKIMKADEKQVDTVLEHEGVPGGRGRAGMRARRRLRLNLGRPRHAAPVGKLPFPEQRHGRGAQCSTFKTETECQSRASGGHTQGESVCLL